jgi:DNA-directed RNA polymerase specialized sigma subunit
LFDGNVGLIESAYRFDPEKGRFSTIAVPAIARSVKDGIMSRIGSTVTVTKNAAGHAYKIKNLDLGETSELKDNELALAKLASFALMDAISIYDENGDPINDLVDPVSMMDEIQMNDLVELVSKAAETLGLSEDDLILVSEASQKRSEHGTVRRIADKKGVSTQAVRMYRLKIIWQIRKEVLRHVGKTEYLMLSGKLPVINWREVCKK